MWTIPGVREPSLQSILVDLVGGQVYWNLAVKLRCILQLQVLMKWLKVFVRMRKGMLVLNTIGRDDGVNCLAHGKSLSSQCAGWKDFRRC